MPLPVFSSLSPVVLVGAGQLSAESLTAALTHCDRIVAADGGAAHVLAAGHMPDAVIGDFDSLSDAARAAIPPKRLHGVAEQDTTDFEKCLTRIAAPLILAAGFTGGRMDHALAVLSALVRHSGRRCVVVGQGDIAFHLQGRLRLDLPARTRVSLFPMRPVAGRASGLRWPIDHLQFEPWGQIGTSNEAIGGLVELAFDAPGMLVILPPEHLGAAVAALTG